MPPMENWGAKPIKAEDVIKMLGRALVDGPFRTDLLGRPEQTLVDLGFEPSPNLVKFLKELKAADLDKDNAVSAQEAYDYAVRKVADSYKSDTSILTERARIMGPEPSRFVVARLGRGALFASDTQLVALRAEQDVISARIAEIKARKGELQEDAYYAQLEPALLEMARVGQRIDNRFRALGVNVEEGDDATP